MTPPLVERRPDQTHRIPVMVHERHHRAKYRRPLRKALFFALREGIGETLRKVRSKALERRIEAAQEILVCGWGEEGDRRMGVTRDLGGVPRFHPELVFRSSPGRSVDDVELGAATRSLLEAYLPVPDCPLAEEAARAIRSENPWLEPAPPPTVPRQPPAPAQGTRTRPEVFLLGFGGYVREQILPTFRGDVAGAVDHKAELIRALGGGAGFPLVRDLEALLPGIAAAERPLVIVATYHSDHAPAALAVLDANPEARVFIEKPATLTLDQAEALASRRESGAWVDVGFNRRHAPFTGPLVDAARRLPGPLVFSALVKELKIPSSHWYRWPNQGTRVMGNVCHWVDLAHHLIQAPCESVRADAGRVKSDGPDDHGTVSATLRFGDGSLATLVASELGDDLGGVTEHLELRGAGTTVVVDDYRRLEVRGDGRRRIRRGRRDRGHRAMYRGLRRRWLEGGPPEYPGDHLVEVTRACVRVVEALDRVHLAGGTALSSGAHPASRD